MRGEGAMIQNKELKKLKVSTKRKKEKKRKNVQFTVPLEIIGSGTDFI